MYIHDVKDVAVLQVPCQESSTSSKYTHQGQGVLDTPLIILECWNLVHKNNYVVKDDPCPSFLQSGTLNVLQVTDDRWGFLTHF